MTYKIDREKIKTEKGKQLYDMLKLVWGNDEWISGVMSCVKSDEKKQILINALETNLEYYEFEDDLTEYADKIFEIALAIERGEILTSPTQKTIVLSLERYIPTLEII